MAKMNRRGGRSFRALDSWWLDVKLGVRMLIKFPGLALAGGLGLAVAVAIATGGFSIIYGNYLAASLPFEEAGRIVSIEMWDAAASRPERRILRDYHVWRGQLTSIQETGAFRTLTPNLIAPGARPASVRVASMSASGFRLARVRPLLGRYLVEDDEIDGAPSVVVIGESIWRNRFAGDPAIVGRTIQLGADSYSIVGVMPEGFLFPVNHRFWTPLRARAAPAEPLTGPDLRVFGRLAPGATIESAQSELTTIGRRAAQAFPKLYAQLHPRALPYTHPFLGLHGTQETAALHVMQGIVTSLLVLVCLNVAILMYTRTATRHAEIAIRAALGAGRGRIVGQLFIEALVLSAAAAAAGVAIAAVALRQVEAAIAHIAADLPFWLSFDLSRGAVLYAGALSVFAAAIVGVIPALKATGRDVQTGIRIAGTGGSGMRLGKTWTALIVAQVGFAVALLPASVSSAWEDLRDGVAGPGFAAEEFLTAHLGMDNPDPSAAGMRAFTRRYASLRDEMMRRLRADPRIAAATFGTDFPGDEHGALIEAEGAAGTTSGHEARVNRVDVNFFRAFEVPVLAGRGFEPTDVAPVEAWEDAPESGAVVVNQTLAQRIFGGDALGKRIRHVRKTEAARNEDAGRWYEIVGIVQDFPAGVSPGMDDVPLKFYHAAAAGQVQPATLALRVRGGDAAAFAGHLREIAAAIDPGLQLRNIVRLDEALRKEQWITRVQAAVAAAITLAVLLLSSAGIYALMSFTISQRRKEIGIRLALGAGPRSIVASIFSRALGQLAAGAALGIASAALLENTLGITRGNAAIALPAVALLMMAVGFLAALGPARRCLRIEPTEALRQQ